jgi:2-polyprenyl-3-methyl-5-hydroxy-6-metoxy-1,4-benzoquinol methylase
LGEDSDLIQRFAAEVLAENPMHRAFVESSLAGMSDAHRRELLTYIDYCADRGLSLEYLANCYSTITLDIQVEQIYFIRHKKYRYSTFKEVADKVYYDDEYMKKYMYGLALTYFLWPNHAAMQEFFIRTFPRGRSGTYLEIGPGHGYYLRRAAELGSFARMVGVDVSPTSVALSKDIMQYYGVETDADIQIQQADFLQYAPLEIAAGRDAFSCIVMGEVLEHVENPGAFLRKIRELSDADTHIYVTTCTNAPAVDHIFLFSTLAEVEALAGDNGLTITDRFVAPYAGKSVAECDANRLPVNVAYVLRKQ